MIQIKRPLLIGIILVVARNAGSCLFATLLKYDNGEFTIQPLTAEEWAPSSALSFKQKEVVAYAIG